MASYNISGSADALQPHGGLFKLLSELDEAQAESYLSSSEGASPRLRGPFSGLLLSLKYDPVEVLDLVDRIWPERVFGRPGSGRKSKDPLPIVCYLLPLCDAEYGVVFNLREAYRRLEGDREYRSQCGCADSLPSESVFRKVAAEMRKSWKGFQACVLSPESLEALLARIGTDPFGHPGDSTVGEGSSLFEAELRELGWNGNLPPCFHGDDRACKVSRVVGLPRGRTCKSAVGANESDGPVSLVAPAGPKSYGRDWKLYNGAQTHEVTEVKGLLGGLSDLINLMELRCLGSHTRRGRAFPLGHVVFATVLKAYSGLSTRRNESLLAECVEHGYLRNVPLLAFGGGVDAVPVSASETVRIPQFNTVSGFLRSEWLTPLLLELVTVTACPLKGLEREFAVDGTGWSTRWYDRWLDHRLADESDRQQWVKLHLVVGVKSNVIARAAISPGSHHDHPYFRPLVIETAKRFDVETVVADSGYSSRSSYELGGELGLQVRIPFKDNTRPPSDDGSEWSKNLRYFNQNYEQFMSEYHPRSNVESTNSSLKRVMPEKLRAKGFGGQTNEALVKLVAYNIRVLAREVWMRDIPLDLPSEVLALEDCIRHVVDMRGHGSQGQAA